VQLQQRQKVQRNTVVQLQYQKNYFQKATTTERFKKYCCAITVEKLRITIDE
jgi:hypothetical protein